MSQFPVLFDSGFEVYGDDGLPLRLPLHVSAGPSTGETGLLDAFVAVADERSIDDVRAGLSAELALVFFEIQCHVPLMNKLIEKS